MKIASACLLDGIHMVGVIPMERKMLNTLLVRTGEMLFLSEFKMNNNLIAPYHCQVKQIIGSLLAINQENPDSFLLIE